MESRARNGVRFMIETSEMVRLGGVTGSGNGSARSEGRGTSPTRLPPETLKLNNGKMGGMK